MQIYFDMKKYFLMAGCMILLAVGMISVACSKDKNDSKSLTTCTCKLDGSDEIIVLSDARLNNFDLDGKGIKTCAELLTWLKKPEIKEGLYDEATSCVEKK